MALRAEQDVYEPDPTLDIYEALGVSPDVSPVVAQTMYWARISDLRREEAAGDLEARQRINELNVALQIILDPERRTDYDRLGVIVQPEDGTVVSPPSRPSPLGRAAWQAALAVIPAVAAGLLTLVLSGEPFAAVVVAATPILAAALLATKNELKDPPPLKVLELAPGATADQIDLSYRTLASFWLSRIGSAPEDAMKRLDLLDRAYPKALEQALTMEGLEELAETPRVPGPIHWAASVLGSAVARAGSVALSGLRSIPGTRGRVPSIRGKRVPGVSVGPLASRTSGGVRGVLDRGVGFTAKAGQSVASTAARARERASEELAAIEAEEVEAESSLTIDLERRLRASIQAVAEQVVEETATPEPDLDGRRFRLVLESAAGYRRIPVSDHPVRIGTSDDADIMVQPGEEEEFLEDTLIWVSGGELVLHNAPGGQICQVNGRPSNWARLDAGDVVTVGGTSFSVEDVSPESEAAS